MIDTRDSSLFGTRNPMEGEVRIPSGCAIAGIFHKKGGKIGICSTTMSPRGMTASIT